MPDRRSALSLALLLAVGAAFRAPGLLAPSLWFDEIYGATFATMSPLDALIAALRFDIHPPLYYLQLSAWGALGSSDTWLYANSMLYSLAAIAALYLGALRFFDARTAAFAAGFLALSPPDLLYAQSVRMYSMAIFLAVLTWIANHRLAHGARGWRTTVSVLGSALLLTYSHALGFFMASFFGLYALAESARVRRTDDGAKGSPPLPLGRWLALWIPIGITMLPAAGNALVRSTAHATAPDAATVLRDASFFVFGTQGLSAPLGHALTLLALGGFALALAAVPRARPAGLCIVLAPCAVMLVASHLYEPMWNRRSLAFVHPFLGLTLALGVSSIRARRGEAIAAAAGIALAVFALLHIVRHEKAHDFPAAAAIARSRLPDGGTLFIPQFVDFWALNRYFVGPDWGSPLAVQANAHSERWDSILAKLGPELCDRLRLVPETTRVSCGAYDLVIGPIFDPAVIEKRPVLMIHSDELKPEERARLTMFEPLPELSARGLWFHALGSEDGTGRLPD